MELNEALGSSVTYEEHKGDFEQASKVAEAALSEAYRRSNGAVLGDALIARGIVHLLQGEPPAAIRLLEKARQHAGNDPGRCLRAASYVHLAVFLQFNTFPDRSGSNAAEVNVRWQGVPYLQAEHPLWQSLLGQTSDPLLKAEAWLVHQVLPNLQPVRATLESSRLAPPIDAVTQMVQNTLQGLAMFQQAVGGFPYVDLAAADLCRRAGRVSESYECLQKALGGYKRAGDAAGEAACNMTRGDWLAAPFSSPLVLNWLLLEGSTEGSDLAWTAEAREAGREGFDADGAQQAYDEAERLFAQARAPRGLAAIQLRRAYLVAAQGDFAAAARLAERAQDEFQKCGDTSGRWLAQTHMAIHQVSVGRVPEPTDLAKAIGTWGAAKGSFSFAIGLGFLFNRAARHWLIRVGNYERALACSRLAQTLFIALGARSNEAQSLVDQGKTHQAFGDRITALTLYEQALDVMDADILARPQIAEALRRRIIMLAGSVYQLYLQLMDPDGMERSAHRIAAQVNALPACGGDATRLTELLSDQLANPFAESGEDGVGMSGIEMWSLASMGRSTVEQAEALTPLYRAVYTRDAGDDAKANQLFEQALAAARRASDDQRDFLEATVFGNWKRRDESIAAFMRHLGHGGADSGYIGALARLMGTLGGAQGEAEKRIQQERTNELAFAFMVVNKAYERAEPYLKALESSAGKDWWKRNAQPWQSLSDCGEMYEGLAKDKPGDLRNALAYYDDAIAQLEARRSLLTRDELKTALASDKGAQYLYFLAARAALKAGEKARAFHYVESGRSRALLDLLAATHSSKPLAEQSDTALGQWRQLNAQLALRRGLLAQARGKSPPDPDEVNTLTRQITASEEALRHVEAELARTHPNFQQAISVAGRIISLDEACAALPCDTALLEYAFLGEDLIAWAITPQGMTQTHIAPIDAKALARKLRAFHDLCAQRQDVSDLGETLAQTLLAPFAVTLQTASHLVLVPYGTAHLLPFGALPFEGQPLGATHTLSYLPSVSVLQFLQTDGPRLRLHSVLAVGNPSGDLTNAEIEASFIARLFGQKALIRHQATELAVRSQIRSHPLLHFATHGKLSAEAPLSSSILLANEYELTVYELMGLRLNADLVVLSACETGRGETTGGDDVLGLTRGLLAAGARAAIVSLWPVDDLSTSLFMGKFYRGLQAGQPAAISLQAAQNYLRSLDRDKQNKELAKMQSELDVPSRPDLCADVARHLRPVDRAPASVDYGHPYYWAPFILVGAPAKTESLARSPDEHGDRSCVPPHQ
jgi:CHAT domain-containing protein/tetratricopeptide (TPR) repeat protein